MNAIPARVRFGVTAFGARPSGVFALTLMALVTLVLLPASVGQAQDDPATEAKADPAGAGANGTENDLPEGVLARVNGVNVRFEDYSRFLLALYGRTKLNELVDRILVEQEAQRLELKVTQQEVREAVDAKIDQRVAVLFNGNRERFENVHLDSLGMEIDEYRDFLAQREAYELLQNKCIVARREDAPIDEAKLRALFEQRYGEDGVRYQLRHILVAVGRAGSRSRGDAPPRSEEAARKRAEEVLARARGGENFVTLVREYSEDPLSRRRDGLVPGYRSSLYGEDFHDALGKLENEGQLSGVVRGRKGFHVIQLISRETAEFEEKKEELEREYRNRPPGAADREELVRSLRNKAEIVVAD